jgi:pimeloyl-ACP methyl ester carboxylesterase
VSAVHAAAHVVEHGGIRLHVLERWCGDPAGKPVAVLVHGSTTPGGPTFDLEVPGRPWTSLAQVLARAGLDVFVPDVRGFGRSTLPEAGVAAPEAVEDVAAAIALACGLRAVPAVSLVGFSWGAQVAGRVRALVHGLTRAAGRGR